MNRLIVQLLILITTSSAYAGNCDYNANTDQMPLTREALRDKGYTLSDSSSAQFNLKVGVNVMSFDNNYQDPNRLFATYDIDGIAGFFDKSINLETIRSLSFLDGMLSRSYAVSTYRHPFTIFKAKNLKGPYQQAINVLDKRIARHVMNRLNACTANK